jgi:hypothetical protein
VNKRKNKPVIKLENVKYLTGIIKSASINRKSYLDATGEEKSDKNIFAEDEIKNIFSFRKSFSDLDYKYRLEVFDKIKNSGILELVEQIGGMREFARKRFSNDEFLRRISNRY